MKEWKSLRDYGYKFYEISNEGNLRHIEDPTKTIVTMQSREKEIYVYLETNERLVAKEKVAELVARAFIGAPENGQLIKYIDNNPTNVSSDNLSWVGSLVEARIKKFKELPEGPRRNNTKLTMEQVNEIREIYVRGSKEFGTVPLAKKYGVSPATITNVMKGNTWNK